MARRVVVMSACKHGVLCSECSITYRELRPGSYALVEKVDGEWPEWALRAAEPFKVFTASDGYPAIAAREESEVLDALAEGEQ